jgi:hypothetical protein
MNPHIKSMLKFSALFIGGSIAVGSMAFAGFVGSVMKNTKQDPVAKDDRDRVYLESSKFTQQVKDQKSEIYSVLKAQEKEYLDKFDPKSEELPELLGKIIDIFDGKASPETAIEIVQINESHSN